MTDKELIAFLRKNTLVIGGDVTIYDGIKTAAADRLEALLAENEHLREATKMVPQWRPVSNADHIRAMTDEELVDFLWQFNDDSFENVMPFCKNTVECGEKLDSNDISTEMCKRCLLDKLRQPYESPTGQKG